MRFMALFQKEFWPVTPFFGACLAVTRQIKCNFFALSLYKFL